MKKLIALLFVTIICLPIYSQTQIGQDIEGGGGAGFSLDISNSGHRVIVGSPFAGSGIVSSDGKAVVYELINGSWVQVGSDLTGPSNSWFGFNVSISGDGNTFAVGSNNGDSGLVTVFKDSAGILVQKGEYLTGNKIGWAVDISDDGNTLAVASHYDGIGLVRVYRWINSTWTKIGYDISESFLLTGYGIELSNNGNILAVGIAGLGPPDTGFVKTYTLINDTINDLGNEIQANDQNSHSFGYSLSFSDSGQKLVVGNFSAGKTSVYEFINNTWTKVGSDIVPTYSSLDFGFSVSISSSGNTIAIGSRRTTGSGIESGRTEIYHWSTNTNDWEFKAAINGEFAGDKSGYWVSLSDSGDTVAIGAPNHSPDGQVRIFNIGMLNIPESKNQVDIFPNPTSNRMTVSLGDSFEFQIYNLQGQLIESGQSEGTINLTKLASGTYNLLIFGNNRFISRTIEKI